MPDFKAMSLDQLMTERNKRMIQIARNATEKKFGAMVRRTDEEIEQLKIEQEQIRVLILQRLENERGH